MAKRKPKLKTNPNRLNPYTNFKFTLKWDGGPVARFQDVTIGASVVEAVEGTEPGVMRRVPALHKTADITFKRGVIDANALFSWIQAAVNREPNTRKDVEIAVVGDRGRVVVPWVLANARISKFQSGDFKAKGNDVAIETLELTNEGIEPT
jgi:phage tail-like protein